MLLHLPADHSTAAEAATFARPFADAGVGFTVGPRLLARSGVAAVTALRAFGPVLADARLGGSPASVAAAARTLASGGATRVTLGAGCGPEVVHRVAEAVAPHGAIVVVAIVDPEAGPRDTETLTGGAGRGRTISRVAAAIGDATEVEVLGIARDIGVVAQANPSLRTVVTGVGHPREVATARERGASAVVLAAGVVTDTTDLAPFVDATG